MIVRVATRFDVAGEPTSRADRTEVRSIVDSSGDKCTSGRVDLRTPDRARAAAWAIESVAQREAEDLVLPVLPAGLWACIRAGWARKSRAHLRSEATNLGRPGTDEAWRAVQVFQEKADGDARILDLVQGWAIGLFFLAPIVATVASHSRTPGLIAIMVSWLLTFVALAMAGPAESLINETRDLLTILDTDPTTCAVSQRRDAALLATLALQPMAYARFSDLWAALTESSQRSGIPILRGDFLWAIREAQTNPSTTTL